MYNQEYKDKNLCNRCGNELNSRQERWCSLNCSRLGLKREYKQRNREKLSEKRREKRKSGRLCHKRARQIRKGKKCVRCRTTEKLNVHHIIPLQNGGTNELNNLMVLCFPCHMNWEKRMKNYWIKK